MSGLSANVKLASSLCRDAEQIDINSPDAAAQSLAAAHEKFGGSKLLFYRQGDNYFAVPEKNRPWFFWKQFQSFFCFGAGDKVPYYASHELGSKFAELFGNTGEILRSQMNRGWFFKRAVTSGEITDVVSSYSNKIGMELRENREQLGREMIDWFRSHEKSAPTWSNCKELQIELIRFETDLHKRNNTDSALYSLKQRFATLQFDIHRAMYDSKADHDSHAAHYSEAVIHTQSAFLSAKLKGPLPDTTPIKNVVRAGLTDPPALHACSCWIGDRHDLRRVLVTKTNEFCQREAELSSQISEKIRLCIDNSIGDLERREIKGKSISDELTELDSHMKNLGKVKNHSDKMARLDWIEEHLNEIEHFIKSTLQPSQTDVLS